ncbi:MAG TPA: META domain-containing protein [Actinomycetota bacterium]|nr:META domain-containing protein [Actinomycetota bacterium]
MATDLRWPALALAAVLAAGCGGPDGDGDHRSPGRLDGRSFVSTHVHERGQERPLVPGTRIELSFADGRLSVQAGCNHLGAGYRVRDGRLRLVGGVSTTEMGCDAGRHAQDEWLSVFLGRSPWLELEGPRLTLSGGGTRIRLLDRRMAEPDLPLAGTSWTLETLVEGEVASSVPGGLEATLRVEDGRIRGFDGCGEWSARVVSSRDGVLVLGRIARTPTGCAGATAGLERAVMAVIAARRIPYEIDGSGLALRSGGRELHFRGEPATAG